jgi:hypothetical protein
MRTNVVEGGKTFGHIDPATRTLMRTVRKSDHLFRKLDAWCLNAEMWHAWKSQVDTVEIFDRQEAMLYTVTADVFDVHSTAIDYTEPQLALPRIMWSKERAWRE